MRRVYELPSGSALAVDDDRLVTANALANRFFVCQGFISRPGFDFSNSQHPAEQAVFVMALEAIDYELEYGFYG